MQCKIDWNSQTVADLIWEFAKVTQITNSIIIDRKWGKILDIN